MTGRVSSELALFYYISSSDPTNFNNMPIARGVIGPIGQALPIVTAPYIHDKYFSYMLHTTIHAESR